MAFLKGIDVSMAQGDVNWKRIRDAGCRWAGVKATEGEDYVDAYFGAARIKAMHDAGIVPMPYHYLRFRTDRPGSREAEHFLRVTAKAGWKVGKDLPLSLDIEWINNETMLPRLGPKGAHEYASDFARKVQAETGRDVVTYMSPGFAKVIGNKHPVHGSYAWVAAWDAPDGRPPTPAGFRSDRVLFHQISASASVGGESPVDVDLFMGDQKDLAAFIKGKQVASAATDGASTSGAKTPPYPGKPLKRGSRGKAVRQWQGQMKKRGWAITVNGDFSEAAERVARAFQQEKHLVVNGEVDQKTWKASWEAPVTRPKPQRPGSIGRDHPELKPAITALAQRVVDKWPKLVVTSTTGGGHSKNSLHYSGRAIDLAVPYATTPVAAANAYMTHAARWVKGHLTDELAEGIFNPALSVANQRPVASSYWGAQTWAAHNNHIHLAK